MSNMKQRFLHRNSRRFLGLLSVCLLAISVLCLVLVSRELYAAVRTQDANVAVQKQADSPLTLKVARVSPSDPKAPAFSYEVLNTGSKVIRAYAIRSDATVGSEVNSDVSHSYLHDPSAFLYPGTSRLESFGSVTYGGDVSKVVLSVDYVEFEDGSTWGDDNFKISEEFDGQRAGYKAVIEKLREMFKAKGRSALLSAIETDLTISYPQVDKSQRWKDGFDNGLKIARARLKHVHRKGGAAALEDELEKPLEESKGRQ